MRQYISEARALYEDSWHGQFSKKLAEWGISKMRDKNGKPVEKKPVEKVMEIMRENGAELPEKYKYTAWYLYHKTLADNPHSLPKDEVRAYHVYETICDPDGCDANPLDCFVTKMCNAGEPIDWEEML